MNPRFRDFILAQTAVSSAPLVPEISLYLASEVTPLWHATEDLLAEKNIPPPFWAFVWPGGQAMTRYLLDHPHEVCGKRVLDFASGCGIAAIACLRCGAAAVEAADIDPVAIEALRLNLSLNDQQDGRAILMRTDDVTQTEDVGRWDLIVAGDVCYEGPMAEAVMSWLRRQAEAGTRVLLADPGRTYRPGHGLERIADYVVPTSRELEDGTTRQTTIYRVTASSAGSSPGISGLAIPEP